VGAHAPVPAPVGAGSSSAAPTDDASTVDALLAGLLAPSALPAAEVVSADAEWAWEATRDGEEEMRRLLEMLPPAADAADANDAQLEELDIDLDFDMGRYIDAAALGFESTQAPALGVF
jgi:hypothetical protein